jgi:hypothetical protein
MVPKNRAMKTQNLFALLALSVTHAAQALEPMPAQLETQLALAAAPPALRADATVFLLDPKTGYYPSKQGVSKQGRNGVACLVERTQWELGEFRDDLYVPLCYDAAGTGTYLQMIMDTAEMRAKGMSAAAVKAEVERRWVHKTYRVPAKHGLSYMVAPLMRTVGPPDMKVHTLAMPHLMFYAPFASNADIAAKPDFTDHASLRWPFADRQGNAEHTYFIVMVGAAEKAQILRDEKPLLDALCAYREILCLKNHH